MRRRLAPFKQQVAKPVKLGPEHNPWFWNPNRVGVRTAPADFQAKLREIDRERLIEVTWNPISERWQVFYKKPQIQHPVCQGWALLFIVHGPDGEYCPLDERVLARLYEASAAKWGDGKKYFDHIQNEMAREKEKREKQHLQDTLDLAEPSFDFSQIKVAMRGKSNGSKFSTYLAG